MREIVWSRAGRGGRADLLRCLLQALACGQRVYWLVPEPYSHETEFLLARAGGAAACLYAEAVTFALISERVLTSEGGLARPVLDEGGRLLTLRRALGGIAERLRLFRRALSRPDMLAELLAILDECKLYQMKAADLERAAVGLEGQTKERFGELAHILGAYEAACATGAMDSRDRYTLTAEKLRKGSFGAGAHLFVSDFLSFTPQERDVLNALADKAASLHIYLCGEPGDEDFRVTARCAAGLRRGLPDLRDRLVREPEPEVAPALRYLEESWFLPDPLPFAELHGGDKPGTVPVAELWRCGSAAEECRLAAERIAALCEEGYRYRDIHLLYPGDESYAPLLATIFPHYGIPLFMDKMDEVSQKPLFRCVRALLDCVLYGLRPADALSLLRCGLSPFDAEEIDRFEDYLTLWNFRGRRLWSQDFRKSPHGYGTKHHGSDEAELAALNRLRHHVFNALRPLENKKKTAGAHARALCTALQAFDVLRGLRRRRERLEAAGMQKLALENEQLWELLVSHLEQCAGVLGEETLSLEEFGELLFLCLSGRTVGSIPAVLDAVRAGAVGRFARIPAPVVIILGATEDALPVRGGGRGFWGEQERRALEALHLELPPDELARLEREELHLYTAFTLAWQKLILSYPSEKSLPLPEDCAAICVKRTAELLGLEPQKAPPPRYPSRGVPPPEPPPLSPAAARRLFGSVLELSPSRIRLYQQCPFSYFLRYGLRVQERPGGGLGARHVGSILHEVLEKTTEQVAALGGFAALKAEEAAAIAARQAEICVERYLQEGQAAAARITAQGNRLLRAARRLALCLWEELSESRFAPGAFELRCESEVLPIGDTPPEAPGSYRLSGIADRVDLCRQGGELLMRVVDYKSGETGFSFAELYNGVGAQLLQYLFMLKEYAGRYFPEEGAKPVAAGFLFLPTKTERVPVHKKLSPEEIWQLARKQEGRDGLLLGEPEILRAMDEHYDSRKPSLLPLTILKDGSAGKNSHVANRAQMTHLEQFTNGLSRSTAEGIARGCFPAHPLYGTERDNACRYCDARAACGFSGEAEETRRKTGITKDEFFAFLEKLFAVRGKGGDKDER